MRSRPTFIASSGVLALVLMLVVSSRPVDAQQAPKAVWEKPLMWPIPAGAKIHRREPNKPAGKRRAVSRTPIRANLPLSLQCSLRMKGKDGRPIYVPFDQVFHPGDLIQLVITPSQDASLFVFEEEKSSLLFPLPYINRGRAEVKQNQPLILPSSCGPDNTDAQGQCYFAVADSGASLTLILRKTVPFEVSQSEVDWLTGLVRISMDELGTLRSNLSRDYQKKYVLQSEVVRFSSTNQKQQEGVIAEAKIRFAPLARAGVEATNNGSLQPTVVSAFKPLK